MCDGERDVIWELRVAQGVRGSKVVGRGTDPVVTGER